MYSGGEIKEYKQGAYTFNIRQFEPFYAIKVLGELQKVIAPVLDGAIGGLKNPAVTDEMTPDLGVLATIASGSFVSLAQHLSGDELLRISKLLLDPEYVYVKNSGGQLEKLTESVANEVFSGRPFDMIALMVKVVTVNYLDFSKLSSLPAGVRETLDGLKLTFRDVSKELLNPPSLSGEPLKRD